MGKDEDAEKAVEKIYDYAAGLVRRGKSPEEVQDALVGKGLTEEQAGIVARNMFEAFKEGRNKSARRNMLVGGAVVRRGDHRDRGHVCVGARGGTYVVAWGAIIFGAIQFFRGLGQLES